MDCISKNKKIYNSKLFVLDLDGVLYLNNTLIPGSDKAVLTLRNCGRNVVFLTNNSGRTRFSVCDKLNSLGIACSADEVYTSVDIAMRYMLEHGYRKVFYVGAQAIKDQLSENGFDISTPDEAECLLVGFKKDLNYEDATMALAALRRGIPFIACNRDSYFPSDGGKFLPGCNYTVSAIEGCYNRKVDVSVGKPNAYFLDKLFCDYDIKKEDITIVGDLYDSDIAMAKNIHVPAVWIGGTKEEKDVICAETLYEFTSTYFAEV